MKILIIGQPRVGKTTLAERIGKKYELPIYHTDVLRKELGYGSINTNKHIFTTGIDIEYQKKFYDEVIKELPDDYVLEGSAIYPCDVLYFNPTAVVMLSAVNRTLEDMFYDSRKYDEENSYTRKRTDSELLELFTIYKAFEENWYFKYQDIIPTVDNQEYEMRLEVAESVIEAQLYKDDSVLKEIFECFKIVHTLYSFENPESVYRRFESDNNGVYSEDTYNDLRRLNNYL